MLMVSGLRRLLGERGMPKTSSLGSSLWFSGSRYGHGVIVSKPSWSWPSCGSGSVLSIEFSAMTGFFAVLKPGHLLFNLLIRIPEYDLGKPGCSIVSPPVVGAISASSVSTLPDLDFI